MLTTILLVENHDCLRQSLRDWLETNFSDCRVIEAASGQEALTIARANSLSLVVMEIDALGMNGLDVLKRIKGIMPTTQIVVLTVLDDDAHRAHAIATGAKAYVSKTNVLTDLQPALAGLLIPQTEPDGHQKIHYY